MSEKFSTSLKNELAGHALWELIKLLIEICAVGIGGLLGSKLLTLKVPSLASLNPYLSIFISLVALLIFFLGYQRFNRFRPKFPRLLAEFRLLEKNISYEYMTAATMRYSRKFRLKALRNGLSSYTDKYLWTGSGRVELRTANSAQHARRTDIKNVWQMYEVKLERTLRKGDIIEVEVIWDLEDHARTAVPFFSTTVEEPTDLLKMDISMAPALGIRTVTWEISSGIGAMIPFRSGTIDLDKHGEASWVIEKPKLLHYYEIRWHIPRQGA